MIRPLISRAARLLLLAGAAGVLGACDSLLEVENPARIREEQLNDTLLFNVFANSVMGEFQSVYDNATYYSAILSDEAVTGHNFFQWKDIDLRIFRPADGVLDDMYVGWHGVRALADTVSGRYKALMTNADKDLRHARVLAFSGYSYVFLGEFMCESPLNVGAERFTSKQLSEMGIERFEEAIAIATAAKAAGQSGAVSDSIINLARLGAARAALQAGRLEDAATFAAAVPAAFNWMIKYSSNSGRETSTWRGSTTGANRNIGVAAAFRTLGDPRVRHSATGGTGHNGLTVLFTPFKPPSWLGWNDSTTAPFAEDESIRLASGLEARYIVAEASGPNATTLALVNERRAVGKLAPTTATGAALMTELRTQRSRDFFLDGHRWGDLRRYKAAGAGDFFPQGVHQNTSWGNYDRGECLPVPLSEEIGNPNLR